MTPGEVTGAPLRVLVVDDHRTFAELLSGALPARPACSASGTAGSGAQALAMVQDLRPDIVVMDIEMPRQDGLAATRRIRELAPDTLVAVVTAHRDPDWVVRAAQAGASAFIPKDGALGRDDRRAAAGSGPAQMLVAPSTFAAGSAGARRAELRRPAAGADPARAGGARLPRPRHAGQGDRPGARHHAWRPAAGT